MENVLDKKRLGAELKKRREEKKLQQYELAHKAGVSRNYISDIENGRYMPSVNTLAKLVKHLDADLNSLLMSEIQDEKCAN